MGRGRPRAKKQSPSATPQFWQNKQRRGTLITGAEVAWIRGLIQARESDIARGRREKRLMRNGCQITALATIPKNL